LKDCKELKLFAYKSKGGGFCTTLGVFFGLRGFHGYRGRAWQEATLLVIFSSHIESQSLSFLPALTAGPFPAIVVGYGVGTPGRWILGSISHQFVGIHGQVALLQPYLLLNYTKSLWM
jgi:hypothetical protein